MPNNTDPQWLRWLTKYRGYATAAAVALALLLVASRVAIKMARRRRVVATVSQPDELESPLDIPQLHPAGTALATAEQLAAQQDLVSQEDDSLELAQRLRELAKREPAVTANTLRMWLLQNDAAKTGAQHAAV